MFRNDRSWSEQGTNPKRGGGLATLISNTHNFDTTELTEYNLSNCNIEYLWVKVKPVSAKTMIIGNIYRPPGGNVEEFFNSLNSILDSLNDLNKMDLCLLGDFNISLFNIIS